MGHDQVQNLILNEAVELLYSEEESVEQVPLGLYVIRGDNVAIVGEYSNQKLDMKLKTEPLPAIHQQIIWYSVRSLFQNELKTNLEGGFHAEKEKQ